MKSECMKDPNDPAVATLINMMGDTLVEQRETRKALDEIVGPERPQACTADNVDPSCKLDMLRDLIVRAREEAQDIKVSVSGIASAL